MSKHFCFFAELRHPFNIKETKDVSGLKTEVSWEQTWRGHLYYTEAHRHRVVLLQDICCVHDFWRSHHLASLSFHPKIINIHFDVTGKTLGETVKMSAAVMVYMCCVEWSTWTSSIPPYNRQVNENILPQICVQIKICLTYIKSIKRSFIPYSGFHLRQSLHLNYRNSLWKHLTYYESDLLFCDQPKASVWITSCLHSSVSIPPVRPKLLTLHHIPHSGNNFPSFHGV